MIETVQPKVTNKTPAAEPEVDSTNKQQNITGTGLLLDILRGNDDLSVKKRLVRDSIHLLRDSELNILALSTMNDQNLAKFFDFYIDNLSKIDKKED